MEDTQKKQKKMTSGCAKFFWGGLSLVSMALIVSAQRTCHSDRVAMHKAEQASYLKTVWIYDSTFRGMRPYPDAEIITKKPGFIAFRAQGRLIEFSGEYRIETSQVHRSPETYSAPLQPIYQAPPPTPEPLRVNSPVPTPITTPPPTPFPGYPKTVIARYDITIKLEKGAAIVKKGQPFTLLRPLGNANYQAKYGPIDFTASETDIKEK